MYPRCQIHGVIQHWLRRTQGCILFRIPPPRRGGGGIKCKVTLMGKKMQGWGKKIQGGQKKLRGKIRKKGRERKKTKEKSFKQQ